MVEASIEAANVKDVAVHLLRAQPKNKGRGGGAALANPARAQTLFYAPLKRNDLRR